MALSRLAPEDIQTIIEGIVSNKELVSGVAAQLRESIATSPTNQSPIGDTQRNTEPDHNSGDNNTGGSGDANTQHGSQPHEVTPLGSQATGAQAQGTHGHIQMRTPY